ncbi:MAG: 2-hydroxyacid dehydrogenase, partial [Pseudomonadota bacterium]|nr:2-hydroxyacid dehydrogenase [Pseudomonadota bacterium]
ALDDIAGWQVDVWPCDDDLAARDALLETCEAAIMGPDFILTPGNFAALMAAPNLKLVAQPWVGTDWLDPGFLPKGLMVCNAGGHAASMAEHVMASILEHAIELRAQHTDMLNGRWYRSGRNSAPDARHGHLDGKTLGLVGFGEIARAVVRRANAFNMKCCAVARSAREQAPDGLDWIGTQAELPRLLNESDYIALTCDLNAETEGMIDADAFALMKPTAYLINVARGEVIVEKALYTALKEQRIDGAALDTWYRYPSTIENAEPDPDRGGPFQGSQYDFNALDNVLLTPHSSAHTYDADEGRYVSIAKSLREYAQGQTPKRLVATGTGENLGDFKMP